MGELNKQHTWGFIKRGRVCCELCKFEHTVHSLWEEKKTGLMWVYVDPAATVIIPGTQLMHHVIKA